jgi:hypothetical protein
MLSEPDFLAHAEQGYNRVALMTTAPVYLLACPRVLPLTATTPWRSSAQACPIASQ